MIEASQLIVFFVAFLTAELSHSEVYMGEICDDSVPCTVDKKGDIMLLHPEHI